MIPWGILALCALLWLIGSGCCARQPYHNDHYGDNIDIPPDWHSDPHL